MKIKTLRNKVDVLVNGGEGISGILYALIMAVLVLAVCGIFTALTYPLPSGTYVFLKKVEMVITFVFLLDYLLRWYVARFSLFYILTPLAIIDLIAILPLFFIDTHFQFMRVLRTLRILRLLRVFRKGGRLFGKVTEVRLTLFRIFFIIFSIVFIASGLMYEVEHKINPHIETFFDSLYFVVITITTVGFGDIVPVSFSGRGVTLLMIFSGITLIPWQLTELAKLLIEGRQATKKRCPQCSLGVHEVDASYCRLCGCTLVKDVSSTT